MNLAVDIHIHTIKTVIYLVMQGIEAELTSNIDITMIAR